MNADSRDGTLSGADLETLSGGLEIVAYRSLSEPEDVKEAVQETLTRTLEALRDDRISAGASLAAFAHGVHRHVIADILRTRYRNREGLLLEESLPAPGPSPLERLIRSEELRRVVRAVRRLSASDREILQQVYVEGRRTVDIARERDEPGERVRKRKSRALERIRELLADGSGPPGRHESGRPPNTEP